MAAAMMVQQAAGGALLSPAAASFAWQAVAVAAPRVLTLMQSHRNYSSSSSPSTSPPLHLLGRRPSPSSPAPAASGRRGMASYSYNKHTNSLLQVEEEKMRRNKELAMALMQDTQPAAGAGEEEVKGINHLLALLGASDGNGKKGAEDALREHRSLVEKKKRALLVELLNDGDKDGHGRQEKTADLASAARQLRDAISRNDNLRKLQNLLTEMKTLRDSVADERVQRMQSDTELKRLMDDMTAARISRESTNTLVKSIRRNVMEAEASVKLCEQNVESLRESVLVARKESESARGLAIFVCFGAAAATIFKALL